MKRFIKAAVVFLLAVSMLTLSSCGKSEFGVTDNTGKLMSIKAERADKGDFFMLGSLEVDDGEMIEITSNLSKGSVKVEIIEVEEEQSIDVLPDFNNKEAIITANTRSTDKVSHTVNAGNYMLRATCIEKATGTVQVEVKPAE
ncbi:MAG: hypothetical protein IJ899_22070 [Blautia sp.]|nr:hypothetical protein [Blautia sp.]